PGPRASRSTSDQKTLSVLQFMKAEFPRFSLKQFLKTLFTSQDGGIKNYSNIFLADDGHVMLLDIWWEKSGGRDSSMSGWVVSQVADVCARECSQLTDRASRGPHYNDAQSLRISPRQITVSMVESFRIKDLTER
ncbi:hypothetical protein BV22DRAFT_997805, partial [Leucogyrophana mollusca]